EGRRRIRHRRGAGRGDECRQRRAPPVRRARHGTADDARGRAAGARQGVNGSVPRLRPAPVNRFHRPLRHSVSRHILARLNEVRSLRALRSRGFACALLVVLGIACHAALFRAADPTWRQSIGRFYVADPFEYAYIARALVEHGEFRGYGWGLIELGYSPEIP